MAATGAEFVSCPHRMMGMGQKAASGCHGFRTGTKRPSVASSFFSFKSVKGAIRFTAGRLLSWDYCGDSQTHGVAESAFQLWSNTREILEQEGECVDLALPPPLLSWIIVFLPPGCIWCSLLAVIARDWQRLASWTDQEQDAVSPHQRRLQFHKCSQPTQAQAGAKKGALPTSFVCSRAGMAAGWAVFKKGS